ncbi:spore coat U domain-containing protein [Pantoea agglomerans]|uniref:Csu type fimbrial protein n=1 Tax=Enterobacter agglomerans TaxID=549 RepID=UPI000AA85D1D|nr:spore coat U domain-containing protein [Pantoea agglomerans]
MPWKGASLILIFVSCSSAAATTSASFQISATITGGCAFGAGTSDTGNDLGTLDFGTMAAVSHKTDVASIRGAGSVEVTCTPGLAVSVALDYGQHGGSASQRYMRSSYGQASLAYQLYQDAAHSTVWGTGALALSIDSFPATSQVFTVYGRLFAVEGLPAAGTYTDLITVTLTY